jgi:hypothetical protein
MRMMADVSSVSLRARNEMSCPDGGSQSHRPTTLLQEMTPSCLWLDHGISNTQVDSKQQTASRQTDRTAADSSGQQRMAWEAGWTKEVRDDRIHSCLLTYQALATAIDLSLKWSQFRWHPSHTQQVMTSPLRWRDHPPDRVHRDMAIRTLSSPSCHLASGPVPATSTTVSAPLPPFFPLSVAWCKIHCPGPPETGSLPRWALWNSSRRSGIS